MDAGIGRIVLNEKNPLKNILDRESFAILDGGLATELEQKGFDINHILWSARLVIENPEAIKEAHLSYLEAGADIITTASYQASFPGCAKLGMKEEEVESLLRKTVDLALEARAEFLRQVDENRTPAIAASIGPYGAYLANGAEYTGDYGVSKEGLYEFHSRRFEILADTEADLLACETIPSFQEAEVLLEIVNQNPKPAWVSFSCKDEKHINDGTPIKECAELLAGSENVFAIGINCTNPEFVSGLIERLKPSTGEQEVVVYPNSGEIYDSISKNWKGKPQAEGFAKSSVGWFLKGASIIGGCCRTRPNHIKAIRQFLQKTAKNSL